jgi:urease accessory protein
MTTATETRPADLTLPVGSMLDWMRVLQFGDSTLPTGAFSFSHGLESAIERGVVCDADTLQDFVLTAIEQSASGDAIALLVAYRAAVQSDLAGALQADQHLFNRKLNEETRAMTVRTGKKLIELAERVIGDDARTELLSIWRSQVARGLTPGSYPVCLAVIFAELKLPEHACFLVHQYSVAMAILSSALRLMKVDHFDTQRILFRLNGQIERAYRLQAHKTLDDMATFAPVVDLLAAIHVKAHVRLFMN